MSLNMKSGGGTAHLREDNVHGAALVKSMRYRDSHPSPPGLFGGGTPHTLLIGAGQGPERGQGDVAALGGVGAELPEAAGAVLQPGGAGHAAAALRNRPARPTSPAKSSSSLGCHRQLPDGLHASAVVDRWT